MDVLLVTKAFQDSTEGAVVIGSSVVEVEVDGETNYKVVFELEATEETIQAAQQEQQQPCPFGEFDATTTRIESSVFIPVRSYFVPDMERRNIYKFALLRARPPSYPAAAGLRDRTPISERHFSRIEVLLPRIPSGYFLGLPVFTITN